MERMREEIAPTGRIKNDNLQDTLKTGMSLMPEFLDNDKQTLETFFLFVSASI